MVSLVANPRDKGARADSFAPLDAGYAADAGQVYFRATVLTNARSSFRMLQFGSAKTDTQVYYTGKLVPGADAASFATLDQPTDTADAKDRDQMFQQGRRSQR